LATLDYSPQPVLVLWRQANEFDTNVPIPCPSHHGQVDRQRPPCTNQVDLDAKILRSRSGFSALDPAAFPGNVAHLTCLDYDAIVDGCREGDTVSRISSLIGYLSVRGNLTFVWLAHPAPLGLSPQKFARRSGYTRIPPAIK
jgi:hypothetical protein